MKTRTTIKTALCLLFALTAGLLSGCAGAQINLYEQQDDDGWYFRLEVQVSSALERTLHASASFSEKHNAKWTLDRWLGDYFDIAGEYHDFQAQYDGVYTNTQTGEKQYAYRIGVSKKTKSDELQEGLTLSGDTSQKTNLFLRTIHVVRDDRFDYWINAYEDVYDRLQSGEPQPADYRSLMGILLFGTRLNGETELPAFCEAFPAAQPSEYVDVLLRNFWYASQKMNVSYDDKVYLRDSDGTVDKKGVYYVFDKYASEGQTDVEYSYYRADPTGWYIVALVCGGLTVGIIFLVVHVQKKRKQTLPPPSLRERFPYDPFADNDSIDPFA